MKVRVLIDSNVYLDLYTSKDLRELLATLPTIEGLFVSAQIVDEVMRRRVGVTIDALKPAIEATKAALPIPDAALQEFPEDVAQDIEKFTDAAKALRSKLAKSVKETVRRVAEGSDSVSVVLGKVFGTAAIPNDAELSKARARRERGTPPGKPENPLGDQLTWEQFLARCAGAEHVFIVTRDGDFLDRWNGELFLNPVLKRDLRNVAQNAQVYVFDNLAAAVRVLSTVIGATVAVPPPEKLEKAQKAEEQVAARAALRVDQALPSLEAFVAFNKTMDSFKMPATAFEAITNITKTMDSFKMPATTFEAITNITRTMDSFKVPATTLEAITNINKTMDSFKMPTTTFEAFTNITKTMDSFKIPATASEPLSSFKTAGALLETSASVKPVVDAQKTLAPPLDVVRTDSHMEGTPTPSARKDKNE